jgi:hypothetical protein
LALRLIDLFFDPLFAVFCSIIQSERGGAVGRACEIIGCCTLLGDPAMPDSPHVKGKVVIPIKKTAEPAAPRGEGYLPALAVQYYKRLKRQRLYPLVVRWSRADHVHVPPTGESSTVVVRPVIPGALIVPTELPLSAAQPDATATFQVTPLARGHLNGARVDVLYQGKQVGTVPLPMNVVRISLSGALLALAFLIPLFLMLTTGNNKLTSATMKKRKATEQELKSFEGVNAPTLVKGNPNFVGDSKQGDGRIKGKVNAKPKGNNDESRDADDETPPDGKGATKAKGNSTNAATEKRPKDIPTVVYYYPGPGEVLTDYINQVLPPIRLSWSPPKTSEEASDQGGFSGAIAAGIGAVYQALCDAMQNQPQLMVYGCFLLFLVASLLLRSSSRVSVRGKPIALARPA